MIQSTVDFMSEHENLLAFTFPKDRAFPGQLKGITQWGSQL